MTRDFWKNWTKFLIDQLQEISDTPITCRNPDGVDQAAEQMKLIADEALTLFNQVEFPGKEAE